MCQPWKALSLVAAVELEKWRNFWWIVLEPRLGPFFKIQTENCCPHPAPVVCSGLRHRWHIWRISGFWRQFGEGVDVGEKISMNEDNSRCPQPPED
jgi:hypothetical protein